MRKSILTRLDFLLESFIGRQEVEGLLQNAVLVDLEVLARQSRDGTTLAVHHLHAERHGVDLDPKDFLLVFTLRLSLFLRLCLSLTLGLSGRPGPQVGRLRPHERSDQDPGQTGKEGDAG
ncbi:MAG TPA: hypothetical protein VLV83_21370 [Acidobacteriota bacterium]|nr:hypothetical protein [Acidobacteriota bacterium]